MIVTIKETGEVVGVEPYTFNGTTVYREIRPYGDARYWALNAVETEYKYNDAELPIELKQYRQELVKSIANGLLSGRGHYCYSYEGLADDSIRYADAIIEKLRG